MLEEAPSAVLSPELRQKMGDAAVKAAKSINYVGAGTIEFLLDKSGDFYFMEMNTRIQVEHPVTEMVTSIDLIPGRIIAYLPPGGPGVRMDSHVYTDYEIPPYYDSLIGKLIVWGENRDVAIKRMKRALRECAITGVPTTIEFHQRILETPAFLKGEIYTNFIAEHLSD